jgi:hypothetical protein
MNRGPDRRPVESRLHGDLPIVGAEAAAAAIAPDATVLTSGFGSVGYPKAIPLALAESPRDLSLTLVASGKVGDEIDVDLVGSGQVERRFSYQSSRVAREKTDAREIAFSDRNASSIGDEVQYGGLVEPDVAVVEAVAVGDAHVGHGLAQGRAEERGHVAAGLAVALDAEEVQGGPLHRAPHHPNPVLSTQRDAQLVFVLGEDVPHRRAHEVWPPLANEGLEGGVAANNE